MLDFEDTHLFKKFRTFEEKERWWIGRLVKVKETLSTLHIATPEGNEIGVVIKVQETNIGCHLKVFFGDSNASSWIMTRDVYSQADKK